MRSYDEILKDIVSGVPAHQKEYLIIDLIAPMIARQVYKIEHVIETIYLENVCIKNPEVKITYEKP